MKMFFFGSQTATFFFVIIILRNCNQFQTSRPLLRLRSLAAAVTFAAALPPPPLLIVEQNGIQKTREEVKN